MNDIKDIIKSRIENILIKRGFDPSVGAAQASFPKELVNDEIYERIKLSNDYARFDELCKLAKFLEVEIPTCHKINQNKVQHIYMIREYDGVNSTRKVKVGRSIVPYGRKKEIGTGNSNRIDVEYDIVLSGNLSAVKVEGILKRYLSKRRDANSGTSKEWFFLSPEETKQIKLLIESADMENLKSFICGLR